MDLPKIYIGFDVLSNFSRAIQTEWIATNGLGGYASSTVLGINTRKYHGLLVASLNPPVDRWVFVTKLDEEVQIENKTYPIGSNEFRHGIQPMGYRFLSSFSLAPFPTYSYHVRGVQLQKTIFMPYEKNATIVGYRVLNLNENNASIRILPLINYRHFHSITNKDKSTFRFIQKPFENGVAIQLSPPTSTLIIFSTYGQYLTSGGKWIEDMYFQADDSRGESCLDDNFQPGCFELNVAPRERKKFYVFAIVGKSESEAQNLLLSLHEGPVSINDLYEQEFKRQKGLLIRFQEQYINIKMEDWLKWLILTTNSFIVHRESTKTKSVIAGYHWFEDWGRDSLISLPGLTLVTGRFEDAKDILLTFKYYCHMGIVPNRFPDQAGNNPVYNTVDATLWYFNAVLQYIKYTGDLDFVQEELWNTLQSMIEHHVQGTLYDIRVDEDGLITHGPQLTWMDAIINGSPITRRDGKAVEIQALWYNALKTMELLATHLNQKEEAKEYSTMAERAKESFREKFWDSHMGCLFDVVHKEQRDLSLRPNQVIAISLDFSMPDKAMREAIVETVWKRLWGRYGLKTLPEDDPRYVGKYLGDRFHRDNAYHNGTVWPWLLGPFITAFLKVKNYEERWRIFAFKNFLQPLFQEEVFQAGLGTISEIFDGDPPHTSQGCIAQAWSVAEPLRAYVEDVLLKRPPHEQQIVNI